MKKLLLLVALVGGLSLVASTSTAEAGLGYGGGNGRGYRGSIGGGFNGFRSGNFGGNHWGQNGYRTNYGFRQSYGYPNNYNVGSFYTPNYGGCEW